MTSDAAHYLHSSARENVLEHLFVGEILRTLWCKGIYDVEVLRSEVDDRGYDVVIECKGILRHIQLKSSHRQAKAKSQKINTKITAKPGGCVVWMLFDPANLELGPFRWFGGAPGEQVPSLGNKIARHTKGNRDGIKAERPNIRVVSKSCFRDVGSMSDLAKELFGDIVRAAP